LRAPPIKSSESPRSWIVNSGTRPIRSAYSRRSLAPALWNVPAHGSTMGTSPARPRRSLPTTPPARRLAAHTPRARLELDRRAAAEREEKDPAGIGAVAVQARDAMGDGVGL